MRGLGPNPISEFVSLVATRIAAQERSHGEALPHLYLARDFLTRLHELAEDDAEVLWRNV